MSCSTAFWKSEEPDVIWSWLEPVNVVNVGSKVRRHDEPTGLAPLQTVVVGREKFGEGLGTCLWNGSEFDVQFQLGPCTALADAAEDHHVIRSFTVAIRRSFNERHIVTGFGLGALNSELRGGLP